MAYAAPLIMTRFSHFGLLIFGNPKRIVQKKREETHSLAPHCIMHLKLYIRYCASISVCSLSQASESDIHQAEQDELRESLFFYINAKIGPGKLPIMSLRATKYGIFLVDFAFSTALFPLMASLSSGMDALGRAASIGIFTFLIFGQPGP